MINACNAVLNGMKQCDARRIYGVPKSSLSEKVNGKRPPHTTWANSGNYTKFFTDDEELELIKHIDKMSEAGYGLSGKAFRELAFDFAVYLKKVDMDVLRNTSSKRIMSDGWFSRFKLRHENLKVSIMFTNIGGRIINNYQNTSPYSLQFFINVRITGN